MTVTQTQFSGGDAGLWSVTAQKTLAGDGTNTKPADDDAPGTPMIPAGGASA